MEVTQKCTHSSSVGSESSHPSHKIRLPQGTVFLYLHTLILCKSLKSKLTDPHLLSTPILSPGVVTDV